MRTVLLVLLLAFSPQQSPLKEAAEGRGSLKFHGPVPVLHVYGTPQEMGTQYGTLLKEGIAAVHRDIARKTLDALGGAAVEKQLRAETRGMEAAIPAPILAEMKAAARASGLSDEDYALFNTMFDVQHGGRRLGGCSTMGVTGPASATGEPMLGRNFDLPAQFWAMSPYGLIVVRHPEKKLAWAAVTHPLFAGTHGGLNEKGLAVGATAGVPGNGYNPTGISSMILFRRVLEEASTAAEAEKILKDAKVTVATTLMVMDAAGGTFVAECSPQKIAFRRPDKGTLHETNHFVSSELKQNVDCPRFRWLDQNFKGKSAIDEEQLKAIVAGAAPATNLQAMVFFPKRRSLLVTTGPPPAAKGPFAPVPAEVLFPK